MIKLRRNYLENNNYLYKQIQRVCLSVSLYDIYSRIWCADFL